MVNDNQILVMSRNKFGSEYFSLVGGGVDAGETAEQALDREVREETGLVISDPRLVYIEEAVKPFGTQYIYWSKYPGGEIKLSEDSDEAKIDKLGKNLYKPMWLDIDKLPGSPFLSVELKEHLIKDLAHGFASHPVRFSSTAIYETKEEIDRRSHG